MINIVVVVNIIHAFTHGICIAVNYNIGFMLLVKTVANILS